MNREDPENPQNHGSLRLIFEKQLWHYLILVILLFWIYVVSQTEGFFIGQFLGIRTEIWFYLALAAAIIHQVFVWISWRVELHYSLITQIFRKKSYTYFSIIFVILFLSRFVITCLAIANKNSFDFIDPRILFSIAVVCIIPIIYLGYSIHRYFGLTRVFGIDHFDASSRDIPLVKEGIFKYVRHPMYIFGILIFWIPGLLWSSMAALAVALFYHLYIWVHYFFTEKPDMQRIYGNL